MTFHVALILSSVSLIQILYYFHQISRTDCKFLKISIAYKCLQLCGSCPPSQSYLPERPTNVPRPPDTKRHKFSPNFIHSKQRLGGKNIPGGISSLKRDINSKKCQEIKFNWTPKHNMKNKNCSELRFLNEALLLGNVLESRCY